MCPGAWKRRYAREDMSQTSQSPSLQGGDEVVNVSVGMSHAFSQRKGGSGLSKELSCRQAAMQPREKTGGIRGQCRYRGSRCPCDSVRLSSNWVLW